MAFALNGTNLPSIRCYADALRIWDNATPWRGQTADYDFRPLSPNRKEYLKIHKDGGAIRLRYHYTDCVVYWPDNSVQIEAYSSQSTNTFVQSLAPHGFEPDFIKATTILWVPMLWESRRAVVKTGLRFPYRTNTLKFRPAPYKSTYPLHWELHPDSAPPQSFVQLKMDKKQAKLALKDTNYCDFVPWANAVRHMLRRPDNKRKPYEPGNYDLSSEEVVDLLGQGMDGWMKILEDRGGNCVARVREAIYRTTKRDIVIETEVPCIQGYSDYESFVGNTKKLNNYC